MKSPLKRIEELVQALPDKDEKLVRKYLEKRDFQSVLEIVESDLYKADITKQGDPGIVPYDYIAALTEMRGELLTYMSYLEVPDNSEYNNYY